jgi:peptide/nickel transport system substrate-binding protein
LAGSLALEPLAAFSQDTSLVPKLATEIPTVENGGVAEDLMSVTWTLKEGVVWSDGTPLTSADVVFSWEYCMAEGSGCSFTDRFAGVADVVAVDDLTVRVEFEEPTPYPVRRVHLGAEPDYSGGTICRLSRDCGLGVHRGRTSSRSEPVRTS